jgi:hypothetical protein
VLTEECSLVIRQHTGEDTGIGQDKKWLRFPYISYVCDPIMSSRTRIMDRN